MHVILSEAEVRILGCLIEKSITTPDYYPMTLNALTNACNQKSNRNPAVSFEETAVVRGLDSLREKGLSEKVLKADSRVPKYQHRFRDMFRLPDSAIAILCELMLRGAQTPGELRSRASRMNRFDKLSEVEEVLTGLSDRDPPLVIKLPRQAGRKEQRFMHLLSGKPEVDDTEQVVHEERATRQVRTDNELIAQLQEEVASLRTELAALREDFHDLKAQFE